MKNFVVAHSPDADDIFMYMAIKFGWCNPKNIKFNNIAKDIQTLNESCLNNEFEICAISFGVYPLIYEDYALLRTAVSFGEGYGPKLIKKKGVKLKRNFKVALSGEHTSNALIFKIAYPEARVVYKNFLDIEEAVISGEVDAGVLIHESILNFSSELEVEAEIFDLWRKMTPKNLPLPLGGMAIRRSMPLTDAIECESTLMKAVDLANNHKGILSDMLLSRNLVRVNKDELDTYLNLYANKNSICLNDEQIEAIDFMFKLGYENKIYSDLINAKDNFIPSNYKNIRYS